MKWFKKKKCPCGKDIGKRSAVIQYRCMDPDTHEYIINKMVICAECADDLDKEAQTKKDLKE